MNMSYCRFENTTNDLQDCIYALENEDFENASNYEKRAIIKLLTKQLDSLIEIRDDILSDYDSIEEWIEG